jgi:hypothetical protein
MAKKRITGNFSIKFRGQIEKQDDQLQTDSWEPLVFW